MDWNRKYEEIVSGFYKCVEDISEQYPKCNAFEKCVIALRLKGWTYTEIQKKLGMPAKKDLSLVLKTWAPELIDNSKQKKIIISNIESEIYNILKKQPNQQLTVLIEDDNYKFYITNKQLFFEDWSSSDNTFRSLDPITQQQFLIAIKDQINE